MSESNYVVIEGIVQNLEIFKQNVQFLNNSGQRKRTAGIVAMIQAAAGEPGAVHSAYAASDSGDPVEGFRMRLGAQAVSGNFWQTTFQDGDQVRAVGTVNGKILHAVAVVRNVDNVIWMQPHCERGSAAQKKHLFKYSLVFAVVVFLVQGLLLRNAEYPLWLLLATPSSGIALVLAVTVGMSWNDFMFFAREMDKVGAALGLASPVQIDLFKSTKKSQALGKACPPMGAYYL